MSTAMLSHIKKKITFLFCIAALGLAACSSENMPELHIESVTIYTAPDANQNSATAVDLVIIYDEELVKMLGQMTAAKYFSSSRQLLLDNPSLLDIWHWELVPGQVVQDFAPPQERGDSYAAFVFANYITPGNHRIRVSPKGIVKILLAKNDLQNLAVYDLHEARTGTTVSDVPNYVPQPEEEEYEEMNVINI
jgi:type VI secretion system protein